MSKAMQLKRKNTTTTTSSSSSSLSYKKSRLTVTYWGQEFRLQERVAYRESESSPWIGATIVDILLDGVVTLNIYQQDSQYFNTTMKTSFPMLASIQFFECDNHTGRLTPSTVHFKVDQVWEVLGQGNCQIEKVEQSSITLKNADRTVVLRGDDIFDKMHRLISSPGASVIEQEEEEEEEPEEENRDPEVEIKEELWYWYEEHRRTGAFVAVKDRAGKWYQGVIIDISKPSVGAVLIHYEGFPSTSNEWLRGWDHVSVFNRDHFEPLKSKKAEPGDLQVKFRYRKFYKNIASVLEWSNFFERCYMCQKYQHMYATNGNQVYCDSCRLQLCCKPNCYFLAVQNKLCASHAEEKKAEEKLEDNDQIMEQAEKELNEMIDETQTALAKPQVINSEEEEEEEEGEEGEKKEDLEYSSLCSNCISSRYVKAYTAEGVYWSLCHACYVAVVNKKAQFMQVEFELDPDLPSVIECLMMFKEPSEHKVPEEDQTIKYRDLLQVSTIVQVKEVIHNNVLILEDLYTGNVTTRFMSPFIGCNNVNLNSNLVKQTISQSRSQLINTMLSFGSDIFTIRWNKRLNFNELMKKSNCLPDSFMELARETHEPRTVIARLWPRKTQSPIPFGQTLVEYIWDLDADNKIECSEPRLINNEGIQWIIRDGIKYVAKADSF